MSGPRKPTPWSEAKAMPIADLLPLTRKLMEAAGPQDGTLWVGDHPIVIGEGALDPTNIDSRIEAGLDVWTVVCNYREATKIARIGAQAMLCGLNDGNGNDRIRILARSRGHRIVEKWEATRRLTNFRVATLVAGDPRRDQRRPHSALIFATRGEANEVADMLHLVSRREATDRKARP